jgi:Fe-S oxidoreductase
MQAGTLFVIILCDSELVCVSSQPQLKIINVGCCGMAGTFGHEKENYQDSIDIYALS